MSHLAQILFLFYIFIFALNQERKTVSVKEYAYDIIYRRVVSRTPVRTCVHIVRESIKKIDPLKKSNKLVD